MRPSSLALFSNLLYVGEEQPCPVNLCSIHRDITSVSYILCLWFLESILKKDNMCVFADTTLGGNKVLLNVL